MRYCEDFGFNSKIYSLLDNSSQYELPVYTYLWLNSKTSIVRTNDGQYTYDLSVRGLVDNAIDTLKFMEKRNVSYEKRQMHITQSLVELYYQYNETLINKIEYIEQTWYYIRKLYHYAQDYIDKIPYDMMLTAVNIYLNTYFGLCSEVKCLNSVTMGDFIAHMKKDPFDEREIIEIRKTLPHVENYDENIYH